MINSILKQNSSFNESVQLQDGGGKYTDLKACPVLRERLFDLLESLILSKQQTEQDARFLRVQEAALNCGLAVCDGDFAVAGASAEDDREGVRGCDVVDGIVVAT